MAFADTLRAATGNNTIAASLMESLLSNYSTAGSGSTNTTSASYATVSTTTVTVSVTSGEYVFVIATANASHGTADGLVDFIIQEDGVSITNPAYATSNTANTNGNSQSVCLFITRTPSAGSHAYALKWKAAAGTIYSSASQIAVIRLRTS